ncbi:YeeE/YedE family protein [Aliiroseovarius crassostreae]|uniref:YeeE/YedE family protein n=1 Tax=Aliiroseovarius crassostreae TaxID=154981 RepID=UPI002202E3F7|nr:YeeE/YedE family protein [Aliiroseovarius crassostreae]UWQ09376.1 YeeE/YedE family protein [Aliiroseovarius crassostreae]UWQ12452.1 YeeE/YedE family protein [Aliiroseovarius crassostreae]
MPLLLIFVIGAIFGLGISVSGMANPAKVLNFFDIAGSWDPSLAFVMGGALAVTIPGYWWVFRRGRPVLEASFTLPGTRLIDRKLVLGSVTFGLGWGLAGFCPGAALPVLATGNSDVAIFVLAMLAGLFVARWAIARQARLSTSPPEQTPS